MSVIPCRFFGTPNGCRYGDNCKFYHARGNGQNVQGAFGGRPQQIFNNGGVGQAQQDVLNLAAKSQQNMEAMIDMVKRDMIEWDQGHIYPFSCYGPSASKPCLPGFEEISPDELRYRFYVLNNKMPVDLSREISTMQQARMQYQQISPAVRNILERVIIKGERISSTGIGMASSPTPNVFGVGMSMSPLSNPLNPFGGTSNAQPSSTFGQSSGSSLVGGSNVAQTNGIFGGGVGTGTSVQAPSLFGTSTGVSTPTSNIFGSPPSVVGNPSTNVFGNQATASLFGGEQGQQTLFGGGQQQSIFGGGVSGGLFGSTNPIPSNTTTSLFGGTQGTFGGTSQPATTNLLYQNQSVSQAGGLFSSPPNPNLFGNSVINSTTAAAQTPIFGQQQQLAQNQFQSPTLQGLLTGQQPSPIAQQSTLFGSNNVSQSHQGGLPSSGSFFSTPTSLASGSFGTGTASQIATQPQASLFGTPPTALIPPSAPTLSNLTSNINNTPLLGPSSTRKFVYSNETDLTPEELEAFRAPTFTLENIPIRPPPRSLCGL